MLTEHQELCDGGELSAVVSQNARDSRAPARLPELDAPLVLACVIERGSVVGNAVRSCAYLAETAGGCRKWFAKSP